MAKKFTAVDPQGVVHKRSSQSRTYLFTVVVKAAQAFLDAGRPNEAEIKTRNDASWDRIENEAKGIFPKGEQWRGPEALQHFKDFAIEWMTKHTREGALAEGIAHAHKCYANRIEGGRDLQYDNAGWCGRRDLAAKLADSLLGKGFEDVQILEAVEVVK